MSSTGEPPTRPRDPLGKAALFSSALPADLQDSETRGDDAYDIATDTDAYRDARDTEAAGRGASHLFSGPQARPGTLVLDCEHCGRRTRVTYLEFAALHLPVWLWLPLPGRSHRHLLRCPSCHHRTWLQAHWLE